MAITVLQSDTFDEWRIKTNEIASTIASDSFVAGQIADMVNGSNTENGISVSFDTPTATLNFDVDDFTLSLGGDLSGSADITNLNSATLNASINTNFVSSANTSGMVSAVRYLLSVEPLRFRQMQLLLLIAIL